MHLLAPCASPVLRAARSEAAAGVTEDFACSPLHLAAAAADARGVESFLAGLDAADAPTWLQGAVRSSTGSVGDGEGLTALHLAAMVPREDTRAPDAAAVLRALLSAGADVHTKAPWGFL